jgi:hypothetical protein
VIRAVVGRPTILKKLFLEVVKQGEPAKKRPIAKKRDGGTHAS